MEEIPTLDGYIGLKLSLERLEYRNKVVQRQRHIESLKKQNDRAKREREAQQDFDMKMGYHKGRRPSPSTVKEDRRRERIDLNMPATSFNLNKRGVSPKDEISGQRVKSAGSLKLKKNQGNLFRGPTFDLVYTVPSTTSPLQKRETSQRQDGFD